MKLGFNILVAIVFLSLSTYGKCLESMLDSNHKYSDTTFSLGKGLTIYATKGETYRNMEHSQYSFTTYMSLQLKKGNKTIFYDTSREYQFDSSLYPICRKLQNNKIELLLGVNNRPSMNYFLHLIIQNSIIIRIDSLPQFLAKPKIMGNDGVLEYAGIWDYYEEWGKDSALLMPYVPILFFKFRENGIILDSAMTIKINTGIYGKFEGYHYTETPYKVKIYQPKFNNEIEELEKK